MPKSKLKADAKEKQVAFGKGGNTHGLKLGQRDDIDKLAIIALKSKNKNLLALFEQPMPTLEELLKDETDAQLKAGATLPGNKQKPAGTTTTTPAPAPSTTAPTQPQTSSEPPAPEPTTAAK